jgi:hypothetical protein
VAVDDFKGGETIGKGQVTASDLEKFKAQLIENFKKSLIDYVLKDLGQDKNKILLAFPEFIDYKIESINFDAKPGDVRAVVNGTLDAKIYYYWISWKDVKAGIEKYLAERSLNTLKVKEILRDTLQVLDRYKIVDNVWLVPIKVDVVKSYNFNIDKN